MVGGTETHVRCVPSNSTTGDYYDVYEVELPVDSDNWGTYDGSCEGNGPQGPQGPVEKKQVTFELVNRILPKAGIVRPIHAPPGGWGFFKGAFS
jgi:hypothetical protein